MIKVLTYDGKDDKLEAYLNDIMHQGYEIRHIVFVYAGGYSYPYYKIICFK